MLVDEPLQLPDHLGVAAQRELGLDRLLDRSHPQILEPGYLGLGERLVREVGERRPAPERQRALEALSLWRGGPFTDLAYEPFAQAEITRLRIFR